LTKTAHPLQHLPLPTTNTLRVAGRVRFPRRGARAIQAREGEVDRARAPPSIPR